MRLVVTNQAWLGCFGQCLQGYTCVQIHGVDTVASFARVDAVLWVSVFFDRRAEDGLLSKNMLYKR